MGTIGGAGAGGGAALTSAPPLAGPRGAPSLARAHAHARPHHARARGSPCAEVAGTGMARAGTTAVATRAGAADEVRSWLAVPGLTA